ncbi:hypothetical protein KAZ93_00440 [Patescibacteria group bacterium]|nr:hypothetical protein [Patescibacteria group bacterium]
MVTSEPIIILPQHPKRRKEMRKRIRYKVLPPKMKSKENNEIIVMNWMDEEMEKKKSKNEKIQITRALTKRTNEKQTINQIMLLNSETTTNQKAKRPNLLFSLISSTI